MRGPSLQPLRGVFLSGNVSLRFNLGRSCSGRQGSVFCPPQGQRPPAVMGEVFLGEPACFSPWARPWVGRTLQALLGGELGFSSCGCAGAVHMVELTHQGPRWPRTVGPTGYLLAFSPSPEGGASSSPVADRPHPAHPSDPLISPWFSFPRLPGVHSSSRPWGKMAALGDGQEPPHVLSTVTFESPETPGAYHHHEAQLHLHGHQHGTCLPAPSLRAGSSLALGLRRPGTGSGLGQQCLRLGAERCEQWLPGGQSLGVCFFRG